MYVKDQMTRNPICIDENTPISKALDIMANKGFHRLPIVDNDNHLLGLVTEGLISENMAGSATSLSIYELNYLISKMTVKDIMTTDIITISPDALLEEAAVKMRKHDIGCLIVTQNDVVIGIITQNDIFTAFIDLLGYNHGGTRYVVNIANDQPGEFSKICNDLAKMNANISNLAVYHNARGIEVVIIVDKNDLKEYLISLGYNVTNVLNNY